MYLIDFHSGQIGMYLLMCGFKSGLIGIDLFVLGVRT